MELDWRQEKRICNVVAGLFYGWSRILQARAVPRWGLAAERVVARFATFSAKGFATSSIINKVWRLCSKS